MNFYFVQKNVCYLVEFDFNVILKRHCKKRQREMHFAYKKKQLFFFLLIICLNLSKSLLLLSSAKPKQKQKFFIEAISHHLSFNTKHKQSFNFVNISFNLANSTTDKSDQAQKKKKKTEHKYSIFTCAFKMPTVLYQRPPTV